MKMKILVLGGSGFIGRNVVGQLIQRGDSVTLASRGSGASIQVDYRAPDFSGLDSHPGDWDAVIDLVACHPCGTRALLSGLKGRVGRYLQVSSVAAYDVRSVKTPLVSLTEEVPLQSCSPEQERDEGPLTFGLRKAGCERVAWDQAAQGIPVTIFRPSIVFGPGDRSGRFAYWIKRILGEEKFILPDEGRGILHRTYAPDLAEILIRSLSLPQTEGKAYLIAEAQPMSLRETLQEMGAYLKRDPFQRAVSVSSERLIQEGVSVGDIPHWARKKNFLLDVSRMRRDFSDPFTSPLEAIQRSVDAFMIERGTEKTPVSFGLTHEAESALLKKLSANPGANGLGLDEENVDNQNRRGK